MDKEKRIDDFINDINKEKKPGVYKDGTFDPEDEKLFETIRAVKKTKTFNDVKDKNWTNKKGFRIFSIAAAAALVFIMISGILTIPGGVNERNIVQAVVKAYEELNSYSGTIEIRGEENGEVEYIEQIAIEYKKPWKYKAVHEYDDVVIEKYSDGDRLITIRPQIVEVENVFPEKELWRYHIGVPVLGLESAIEVNKIKTETILGREAVLLEYRGDEKDEFSRVWIDTKTDLPLRTEVRATDRVLIKEFKDISINPVIEDETFNYDLEEGDFENIQNLNHVGTVEDLSGMSHVEVDKILNSTPKDFQLFKVGILEEDILNDYVLRFRGEKENEFLDIYYSSNPNNFAHSRNSDFGRLAGGYVELYMENIKVADLSFGENSTARWFTDKFQIFLVSSLDTNELAGIIEEMAEESITPISQKDIYDEGIDLPAIKEGH